MPVRSPEASEPIASVPAQDHAPRADAPQPARHAPTQPRAAADEAPDHPHPITAQHQAIRSELQLVSALNDALDLRDAAGMRALMARYDALSPEDPQRLLEGYERLADCIEARDPAHQASARANARRYYDEARASTLRRYVRRVCLEASTDSP